MEETDTLITGFMVFFICASFLVMALSVPMILRRVKPNSWYGLRTSKTLADEKVWYEANAYCGRVLFGVALSWIVAAFALRYIPTIGMDLVVYTTIYGTVVILGLLVVVGLSFWRLKSL